MYLPIYSLIYFLISLSIHSVTNSVSLFFLISLALFLPILSFIIIVIQVQTIYFLLSHFRENQNNAENGTVMARSVECLWSLATYEKNKE